MLNQSIETARSPMTTGEAVQPSRVAIVIDGNRRWARSRGLSLREGYEAGADTLNARIRDAREYGIKQLTIYSLSTENLSRSAGDLTALMNVLAARLAHESPRLLEQGVAVRFMGDRQPLPSRLREAIRQVQDLTASRDTAMTLFLAINYGSRAEILHAADRYKGGGERAFQRLLYDPRMQDPQLVIRTGGEQRLSNFLLWQAAYSQLCFRAELWPDFDRQAFEQSLATYQADTPSRRPEDQPRELTHFVSL
jgi:undecaprenyl diphosphate synthase